MKILLFVVGAALACGQAARVEGRVVSDTGEALGKAEVRLALAGVVTDNVGKFVFENVAAGRYTLSVEKAGFKTQRDGVVLDLKAGTELKGLIVKLTPQGVITGKVTDEDGDPLAKVAVSAMPYGYVRAHRQPVFFDNTETDDQGVYRLTDLRPGRYYIRATEPAEVPITRRYGDLPGRAAREGTEGNVVTFYPNAADGSSASALEVGAGSELRGIDIRLRRVRVYSVKGKMVRADDGVPAVACLLQLMGDGENYGLTRVQPDGTFEFRGVPAGAFELVANQICAGFAARREIVIAAANIEGVEVSLIPSAPIPGSVTVEDGDLRTLLKGSGMGVGLVGPAGGSSRQVKADGTFELPSTVGAGRFSWSVGGLPEGTYVKSVHFAGRDVTRAPLDNTGAGGALQIVLSTKAASLSGSAPKETTVRIWPKIPDLGSYTSSVSSAGADQEGGYRFLNLAPGEYYVAAWVTLDAGLAESPEFLGRFNGDAGLVKLGEGGQGTVDVGMISPERIAAEIARLP